MPKQRASIFETGEQLDVSSFAPKARDASAPPPEQVRAVSQAAQFRSREAPAVKSETQPKRAIRRYRTGRNVQFNVKAQREIVETVYAISEAEGWVLGYTLQRAVEALQRELKKQT